MNRKKMHLLVLISLVLCLLLSGCTGLIKPSIGEMGSAAEEEETAGVAANEGSASSESSASGEASGEAAASEEETEEAMAGNLVYHFEYTDVLSSSLGGMNDFVATVDLYDAANESGSTGRISLVLGSSSSVQDCTWEYENGVFTLRVDEFTTYESRDIDGIPTIVSVRYGFFMNSGTVDIPLVSSISTASDEASSEPSGEASEDVGTV